MAPNCDAAGNVLGDGIDNYVYDAEGRLCAVENILAGTATRYAYDAEGRRVAKGAITAWPAQGNACAAPVAANGFTAANVYLRGELGNQDTEIAGSGRWVHTNVFGDGELTATAWNASLPSGWNPQLSYDYNSWLGTRRVQLNQEAQVEMYWLSDPYGDYLTPAGTGADATEHHFTGKERDTESGNDYSQYRYYASSMGRWMSPDPSGLTFANKYNPQTFNLYAYVNNNPPAFVDSTGLSVDCGGGGDPSLVCIVTSAWDTVTSWFRGGNKSNSSPDGTVTVQQDVSIPNQTPGTPIQTSPGYQKIVADAFRGTQDAAAKEAYMNSVIARGSIIGLSFLHSRETIMNFSDIANVQKMTTEEIIESLKPTGSQPMVVRSDGLIMNGNTRLFVLQERGVNIQSLNIPFLEHVPEAIGWEAEAEAKEAEKAAAARLAAAEAEGEGGP